MNEIIRFSTNVRNFFNVEETPKTFQNLTQIWRNGMLTEKSNLQWTIKIILDFPCRVLRLVKIMASPSYLTLSLSTMATTMREVRVSKWVLKYQCYDDWWCIFCLILLTAGHPVYCGLDNTDFYFQNIYSQAVLIIIRFKKKSKTASLLHF